MRQPPKEITSLLLTSVMSPDAAFVFLGAIEKALADGALANGIPEVEPVDLEGDQVKCHFDFTDFLDTTMSLETALEKFMSGHEDLILDVMNLADGHSFELSALVTVDPSLATFGLAMLRVPTKLNDSEGFPLSFWLWHVA